MSNRNTFEELRKFTGMDQKPKYAMMSLYQIPSLLDLDSDRSNKFLNLEPLELVNINLLSLV